MFQPGFSTAVEGDADLRARHRHGRRARRDRRARRPRRRRVDARARARGSRCRCRSRSPSRRRCSCAPAAGCGRCPRRWSSRCSRCKGEALLDLYVRREVEWQGRRYPFHYLPRLLGDTSHNPETQALQRGAAAAHAARERAAIHVDEMVGNQEVVVKNIGPQLARVSGHLRRDGARHRRDRADHQSGAARAARRRRRRSIRRSESARSPSVRCVPRAAARHARRWCMIVDDSLTVRKITSRLLQREGFAVLTAKDGVDALQVLAEHDARRDPARHRDAADGRLRVHARR